MKIATAFAALAVFGLSLAATAHAGPSAFPPKRTSAIETESSRTAGPLTSVVVRYDDLDLSTEADARFLLNRLQKAAALVCAPNARDKEMARGLMRMKGCERAATKQAVSALNAPVVNRLYARLPAPPLNWLFSKRSADLATIAPSGATVR